MFFLLGMGLKLPKEPPNWRSLSARQLRSVIWASRHSVWYSSFILLRRQGDFCLSPFPLGLGYCFGHPILFDMARVISTTVRSDGTASVVQRRFIRSFDCEYPLRDPSGGILSEGEKRDSKGDMSESPLQPSMSPINQQS